MGLSPQFLSKLRWHCFVDRLTRSFYFVFEVVEFIIPLCHVTRRMFKRDKAPVREKKLCWTWTINVIGRSLKLTWSCIPNPFTSNTFHILNKNRNVCATISFCNRVNAITIACFHKRFFNSDNGDSFTRVLWDKGLGALSKLMAVDD